MSHRCSHPDHIRYGPRRPDPDFERSQYELQRSIHQREKETHYQKIMDLFHDGTDAAKKISAFKGHLLSPSGLYFKDYGYIPYKENAFSFFARREGHHPEKRFAFDKDHLIIEKHTGDGEYAEHVRFHVNAISLSLRIKREDDKVDMQLHADIDKNFAQKVSLDSCAL